MRFRLPRREFLLVALLSTRLLERASKAETAATAPRTVRLPSSKTLILPLPGDPHLAGGFPTTIALHPGGRYAALLDSGYGMQEAHLRQGIVIVDLRANRIRHFADARLGLRAPQTYFLGLSFDSNGDHLFASVASITDPLGKLPQGTGDGIAVYAFADGVVKPERFIPIGPAMVPPNKRAADVSMNAPIGYAVPYPAGLAAFDTPAGERLLVADDLADDVVLLDAASGGVLRRFDVTTADTVPSSFPYAVVVSRDRRRAWCTLWNASTIAELDLEAGTVTRRVPLSKPTTATAAGSHPTAMALGPDESTLFVALSNTDQVAVLDARAGTVRGYLSTLLPGQRFPGSVPTALAVDATGARLLVADSSANAVAVFDLSALATRAPEAIAPSGFIPTEWYPTALAMHGDDLLVLSGKGQSTAPNHRYENGNPQPFVAALLHGSIARIDLAAAEKELPRLTAEVVSSNHLNEPVSAPFQGRTNPIRHVLYIINENRTYDQILGDLGVGNGDPSLTLYGGDVTPNQHALARQFGVIDDFYDSGEVSGDGHVWSTAATTTDYTEKTWQVGYRGKEHSYDYEGEVAGEFPMLEGIPDVDEPTTGYLWGNAARHGITYRTYGEYISTIWCDTRKLAHYLSRHAERLSVSCAHPSIGPGEPLPAWLGKPPGGSPWPWQIPVPVLSVPTKPELRAHFDPRFAGFQIDYPDQLRADEFLAEFADFENARRRGKETMPALLVMRLPNDHTGATRPGMARPAASVADNDLALGRIVDAVSHSAYWDDTAILVLEDDAQNGADHVDAHRSTAFVISKYAPHQTAPFVDHTPYTTVSMVHTIELLLGMPPMNFNDAAAPPLSALFSGPGDQPAFVANQQNRDNGLLYQVNVATAPGARASRSMNFSRPDAVDPRELNRILWQDARNKKPATKQAH